MADYELFARFYDDVMDDPAPRAKRVNDWIGRYRPDARTVLELACGTGSILAHLTSLHSPAGLDRSLTGLDRSPEMLAVASSKVPGARLVQGDMTSFVLGQRFDVIVSVFDSVNHLLTFDAWISMFDAVHRHLEEGGLFVFDVNTIGELRRLGEEQPWVYDFGDNVVIMDVTYEGAGVSLWDIRIFEHLKGSDYELHHEQIGELGMALSQINTALDPRFIVLEQVDENGGPADDGSVKCHFACRRRGPRR